MALTQKQKIGKVLQGLKKNITTDDRKVYMELHNKKKNIVSYYLNGTVYDIETGMSMISFFTERIADRDREIEKHELQTA